MSVGTNQSSFSELITLAQFGDQEAITELYNRTYSAVYHTTKALIRDEDTVQDVLQDAYIKGFQNLDKLRQPEQYQAWMKMIATNTAKNVLKRKKPILFSEMENEDGEMEVEFVDDRVEHLPEIAMDRKETSRLVSEILDTLPDDQRLVMGMFYYEEMSVQQIARTLGISENTVKSRLNYGRKKVEVKVRDLEKRGTKLYSLAPLPFLLLLLRMQASAEAVPSAAVLDAITAECASMAFGEASAFTAATETAETASKASQGGKFAAQSAKGAARAGTKSAVKTGAKAAGNTAVKAAAKGGAKAVGTKIIAGVLAASLAGGGIYYGADKLLNKSERPVETTFAPAISTPKGTEARETEPQVFEIRPNGISAIDGNAPTSTEPRAAEPEALPAAQVGSPSSNTESHVAYQQVIQNYAQVLSVDSNTFMNECDAHPEKYYNGDHMAVYNYHWQHDTDFLYAYYDINQDGTDELLIGTSSAGIVDVYGFDGAEAVELVDKNDLGSNRAGLSIYQDGSIYFFASHGAGDFVEEWYTILGTYLASAKPTNSPEVKNINWQKMDIPAAGNGGNSNQGSSTGFDTVRERIGEACKITDYDSNPSYYDNQYSDLGPGIVWMLTHRNDGVHTLNVFAVEFDIDNDGEKELCVARAVTPQHNVNVFAIYDPTPNGITAIYGDEVFTYLYPFADGQLPVDWMEWEYLTL